ncbi:MAG: hypothetical protein ABWY26_06205 [Microbacterium sp.]
MSELAVLRDHGNLGLTPLGSTSWRVSDLSVPENDAAHVIAFVEGHEADVEVVWLRGHVDSLGRFEDLDSALDSIAVAVSRPAADARGVRG